MIKKDSVISNKDIWQSFATNYSLTQEQVSLFCKYADMLQKYNEVVNLTAITDIEEIIYYHFQDSLSITPFINFRDIGSICDIGTGAGFPGLPIKIKYPHLKVVLIEVNSKKVEFLNKVIQELNLDNIEISTLDWRTFLRKTSYSIDLFFARASLHTDELLRLFSPISSYRGAKLVYWASKQYKPSEEDLLFFKKEESYKVGNKQRKLIFFSLS